MADFSAVLKKTIETLGDNTPETRAKVYQKARATIEAKLGAITPPPSEAVAARQRTLLEEAIVNVEASYAPPPPPPPEKPAEPSVTKKAEPAKEANQGDDDLESVFAELDPKKPTPPLARESAADHPLPDSDPAVETSDAVASEPELPGTTRRRSGGGLLAMVLSLALLGGAGAAAWFYKDEVGEFARSAETFVMDLLPVPAGETGSEATGEQAGVVDAARPPAASAGKETATTPSAQPVAQKFTQRLTSDGSEIDEGPAAGSEGLGEGKSVAQLTPDTNNAGGAEARDAASNQSEPQAGAEQALPVGQKAIYYEERTSSSDGSAEAGAVVWSVVQESPGNNLAPEPAIRAEVTIPEKNLQMKMTIRRNADQSLPASHVMEIIFLTGGDFDGGGIDNVLRVNMKRAEQDAGSPLLGIPVKVADGFFLVALSDSAADTDTNMLLLRRQQWIDVPVVYKSGRRALITIEKGIPGERIFNETLNAWSSSSAG